MREDMNQKNQDYLPDMDDSMERRKMTQKEKEEDEDSTTVIVRFVAGGMAASMSGRGE